MADDQLDKLRGIYNMEKITVDVWIIAGDMCKIIVYDIRTDIRKLSDGGIICDIKTLLDEMNRIKDEASVLGYNAVFDVIDGR